MLSGISRNPCGARRDHTQHALIPLLRALWARVYLPTRRTRGVIAYTAYTPTNMILDIRDRYCNLDELSPHRYYEELKDWKKMIKFLKDKKLFTCKRFRSNYFFTCEYISIYGVFARERNNYNAAAQCGVIGAVRWLVHSAIIAGVILRHNGGKSVRNSF